MSTTMHYADGAFDRAAERREDNSWLAARLSDPTTCFHPFWRGKCLVRRGSEAETLILGAEEIGSLADAGVSTVLLGQDGDVTHFAVDLSDLADETAAAWDAEMQEVRDVALTLAHRQAAILAYARGVIHWHRTHRYCGVCGSPTEMERAGHARRCSNADCNRLHFPRTDPAVITLVVADERCLLARRAVWQPARRSTVAGFVEPGETLEDAVRREVMEEVGITVGQAVYQGSQPWPFPASLMMGYRAEALDTDIQVDGEEIAEARWYSRDELSQAVADGSLILPPVDSISRWLVETWRAEG